MSDERTAETILAVLAGISIATIVALATPSRPTVELCKCGVACPCADQEKER